MPDRIAEGDELWNENFDNWYLDELRYYYEGTYLFKNALTVVRSCTYYNYLETIIMAKKKKAPGQTLKKESRIAKARSWLPMYESTKVVKRY